MSWTASSTPIIPSQPRYKECERCHHPIVNIEPSIFSHDEMCDYFHFRDQVAPARGLKNIGDCLTAEYPGPWVVLVLESHNIPYTAFQVYGMSGRYWDIFTDEVVASSIQLFMRNPEWAGLSLEEYLTKMVS